MPTRKKTGQCPDKPKGDCVKESGLPPYDPELGDETPGFRDWFMENPEADYGTVMQKIFKEQYNG